jgi:hypothetical protein
LWPLASADAAAIPAASSRTQPAMPNALRTRVPTIAATSVLRRGRTRIPRQWLRPNERCG